MTATVAFGSPVGSGSSGLARLTTLSTCLREARDGRDGAKQLLAVLWLHFNADIAIYEEHDSSGSRVVEVMNALISVLKLVSVEREGC